MGDLPRRIGRYILEETLGAGGTAKVYRARQDTPGFDKVVCVKRVFEDFLLEEGFLASFRDEARLSARLQHDNIVQALDYGEDGGAPYLVLELVDGISLRELLSLLNDRGERLSVPQALAIALAMARGLAYAHALTDEHGTPLGIVHRDVSPQNVLIGRNGSIKLADFGIARAVGRVTRTNTGKVKGKPGYLAPEQALGEEVDARCDQFSLGIILWEMLAAQRLFTGKSVVTVLDRLVRGAVPSIQGVRAEVSPELSAVLDVMLSPRPAQRFPTLEIAIEQLVREHQRIVHDARDTDLRPLLPPRKLVEERTQPNPRTEVPGHPLGPPQQWEAFSTSEVFAFVRAPGRGEDDTAPGSFPSPFVPSASGPGAPRRSDQVLQWPKAPASRPPQKAAAARSSVRVAALLLGAVALAGLVGYVVAKVGPVASSSEARARH